MWVERGARQDDDESVGIPGGRHVGEAARAFGHRGTYGVRLQKEVGMAEVILPGTYITVRDEGLISAGAVAAGNIGIVGTAAKGPVNEVCILGSFSEAREIFGDADPWPLTMDPKKDHPLTLVRALQLIYNNGGRTVYAVRTARQSAPKAA